MLPVIVKPSAEEDLQDIAGWYQARREGYGDKFLEAFKNSTDIIARFPQMYRIYHGSIRKLKLRNFPYAIYYVDTERYVIIIAVIHASMDPKLVESLINR